MTNEFEYRYQVEEWLGRPLVSEELVVVQSLDDLLAGQLVVVNVLARRNRLAALLYLRGVVHEVTGDSGLDLIDRVRDT